MVDFGSQLTSFAKTTTQNFVQKNVNKIAGNLSNMGGGIINSLIGSVSQGLSQNLFDIGNSFDTIESVAARKMDGIVSGGATEFASGGKCADRSTAADISAARNPQSGTMKNYLTDVFPESKIRDKYNEDQSFVLTHSSDTYYFKIRFYPYERKDLFKPATSNELYNVILPLPTELTDAQRAEYDTASMKAIGNILNNGAGDGTIRAIGMEALAAGAGTVTGALGKLPGASTLMGESGINGDNISNAVEQYLGVAPNPNPSVLFKGPSLREFNFSWLFNPRNPEESKRIKSAISKMKASTLPTTEFGSDTGLLRYPHIAMINFFPWDDSSNVSSGGYGWSEESFMRIKRCVISNITADYAPVGAPTFFKDTRDPTFIRVNMTLKEIEFFVSSDWGGKNGDGTFDKRVEEGLTGAFNTVKDAMSKAVGIGE